MHSTANQSADEQSLTGFFSANQIAEIHRGDSLHLPPETEDILQIYP